MVSLGEEDVGEAIAAFPCTRAFKGLEQIFRLQQPGNSVLYHIENMMEISVAEAEIKSVPQNCFDKATAFWHWPFTDFNDYLN